MERIRQRRRRGQDKGADDLVSPRLEQLAALDDAAFRALFAGSPVKRTGRDRFVRNVLIAIGNSNERASGWDRRAVAR